MYTTIFGLVVLPVILGFTVRDLQCNSYRNLMNQYNACTNTVPSDQDLELIRNAFQDGRLTKSELTSFAEALCRAYVPSEAEKNCIKGRLSCISGSEMDTILENWGGICGPNGEVRSQTTRLLSDFEFVSVSATCKNQERSRIDSCFATGSSKIPNRPDPSLTITAGISWWERNRKNALTCSLNALKTMPTTCGKIADIQKFRIFVIVVSEPTGIGAYINFTQL